MISGIRRIVAKFAPGGQHPATSEFDRKLVGANDASAHMNGTELSPVSFQLSPTSAIGGIHANQELSRIVDIFAPARPVLNVGQLAGRERQLRQVIAAIEERRNHVVLFGPKGSGKTSLAMAMLSIAARINYSTIYLSCSRSSTLDSIFRSVLARVPRRYDRFFDPLSEPSAATETFGSLLPTGPLSPQFLAELLERVVGTRIILVLDEFDRHESPALGNEMLELMKSLSDHVAAVHIVLVGAGGSIEDLLGEVSLIPRTLFSLDLQMMDDSEIAAILVMLARAASLEITDEAVARVTELSEGRPFIAKLVALQAAKVAILEHDSIIAEAHVSAGLEQLVDQLGSTSFKQLKSIAAQNTRLTPILKAVLRAMREKGDLVTAEQVSQQCSGVFGIENAATIERALTLLADSGRAWFNVVERNGRKRFRFVDPAMEFLIATICSEQPSPNVRMREEAASR